MAHLRLVPPYHCRRSTRTTHPHFSRARLLPISLLNRAYLLALLLLSMTYAYATACPLPSQSRLSLQTPCFHQSALPSNFEPKLKSPLAFFLPTAAVPKFLSNFVVRKLANTDKPGSALTKVRGPSKEHSLSVDHVEDNQRKSSNDDGTKPNGDEVVSKQSSLGTTEIDDLGQADGKHNENSNSQDIKTSTDSTNPDESDDGNASTSSTLLAELRGTRGQRLTSGGIIELIEWLFVFILVAPGTFPAIGCILYACTNFARRRFFASFFETPNSSLPSAPYPVTASINTSPPTAYPRPPWIPLQRLPSNSNATTAKTPTRTSSAAPDSPNESVSTPTSFPSRSRARPLSSKNSDAV